MAAALKVGPLYKIAASQISKVMTAILMSVVLQPMSVLVIPEATTAVNAVTPFAQHTSVTSIAAQHGVLAAPVVIVQAKTPESDTADGVKLLVLYAVAASTEHAVKRIAAVGPSAPLDTKQLGFYTRGEPARPYIRKRCLRAPSTFGHLRSATEKRRLIGDASFRAFATAVKQQRVAAPAFTRLGL